MLLEETPHQIIEGILIGAYAIGSHHAFIYIRGEFQDGYEIFRDAVEASARRRLHRQGDLRERLRSRADDPSRRGRVHLRRRDRAAQLARRQARRAASQAAVSGGQGPLRRTDRRQQRRDARVPAVHSAQRCGVVRGGRYRALAGLQDRLDLGPRARSPATTRFRSARRSAQLIDDCAGGLRDGRTLHGRAARRRFVGVPVRRTPRPAVRLRHDREGRLDARLGRDGRLRRHDRFREGGATRWCASTRTSRAVSARRAAKAASGCRRRSSAFSTAAASTRDIDMLKSTAHQITGLNLCPLGDSIEPFLGSVVKRFETSSARTCASRQVAA